ncbi:MAG: HAMP domain-containing histidine kinase [Lachnospiraceae bacterium]|nr:HAMP domain-containing histidine kinase [Lachnospiraceae bacterium]
MDTKSKSSKKFSFLAAGAIVALSVVVFIAFYPVLEKQAMEYYTGELRSDHFLKQFYWSNLILYKSMLDKTQQEAVPYSELYLTIEERDLLPEEMASAQNFETDRTAKELKEELMQNFDAYMGELKNEIMEGIAKSADYCVIDHSTGEIMKNTGRNIEKLFTDKKFKGEDASYVYYAMMTYDGVGNLSDVSVLDEKPDELLKCLQSVMSREWLKSDFNSFMSDSLYYQTVFNFYNDKTQVTYRVTDRPKDMTFIYALTGEQKDALCISVGGSANTAMAGYEWKIESAYERAGAVYILNCILIVLAIAALLLTRSKRYCLHKLEGVSLHLEVSLFSMMCMFFGFCYIIVRLVGYTNSGILNEIYGKYLAFLPYGYYAILTGIINVTVLAVYFGVWYYFATSLGEVFDLGLWGFLRERSIIVKLARWFMDGCRNRKERFKEEILHVDLGESAEKTIKKLIFINFIFLAVVCFMWMFGWMALILYTIVLYVALKKYVQKIQEQYQKLFQATRSIAEGNLQTQFEEDWGIFESYKEELSKIQDGFKMAVEEEVKSQRMKTELLTNVSHDLKTPLTAITTYIELLESENLTPEQREEYLGVLKKKSARLKHLIDDLFEVSKASSGNITFHPVEVDICHLMRQVYLEYEDRIEESGLVFRFYVPEEKVILQLDPQKTYRIFENLYTNIIKYAMPNTRVYINAKKTEGGIDIEIKNMSASELNIPAENLTERFVRGDSARNTEGSGLGLAIATSFVELQGGKMKVEIDGDLFKVKIRW